jgi:N-acetylmuramoyl-L-alanine amidase
MRPPLHFGRVLAGCRLMTSDGEFFLSSARDPDGVRLDRPFAEVRELEDHFVAVRGTRAGQVIFGCTLEEVAPPLSSFVLSKLIEADQGIRERVLAIAREARDELTGIPAAVPVDELGLEVLPSGPRPLCVIDIGHSARAPGACGMLDGRKICEFAFNRGLAERIRGKVKQAEIVITSRDDPPSGYRALPAKINALNPNFAISLHANGDDGSGTARGTEVLYWHGSAEGRKLAALLLARLLAALGLPDRGLRPRTATQRGGSLLREVRVPMVIGEPFFITHPEDLRIGNRKIDALAAAYAAAIDAYAGRLSHPPTRAVRATITPSALAPRSAPFEFVAEGLTKKGFLRRNAGELGRLIGAVNTWLERQHGGGFKPLTRHDVWVLVHCEAGLRGDQVDPGHRHSAGERGLLPLPGNIRDWNGGKAPRWDRPMPLARNLEHFCLYLGQLKNKPVATAGKRRLYRDLFLEAGISGNPAREAMLLAGVVHGYFYRGTYRDGKVPLSRLLDGYRNGRRLSEMMAETSYVHAGSPLMVGREKNIREALSEFSNMA